MLFIQIALFILFGSGIAQNLVPLVKEIGGTFCKYLVQQSQLPRNYHFDCEQPTCHWNSWQDAKDEKKNKDKERYVLSYGHNGFGNQLWQHTAAFMIAESLKAKLFIAQIPDALSPGGVSPPNTFTGMAAMERLLPKQFHYQHLPMDSPIRNVCDKELFYLSDRKPDWKNKNYSENFRSNVVSIVTDNKPRCIKMLGYFQSLPLCAEDARQLWTPRMFQNFTFKSGPNDISIYLRCVPRHYFFNSVKFYQSILDKTNHDRIWLFLAPECPTRLGSNPARDGVQAAVLRVLYEKYNATRYIYLYLYMLLKRCMMYFLCVFKAFISFSW